MASCNSNHLSFLTESHIGTGLAQINMESSESTTQLSSSISQLRFPLEVSVNSEVVISVSLETIIEIKAGWQHCLALSNNLQLFEWGSAFNEAVDEGKKVLTCISTYIDGVVA